MDFLQKNGIALTIGIIIVGLIIVILLKPKRKGRDSGHNPPVTPPTPVPTPAPTPTPAPAPSGTVYHASIISLSNKIFNAMNNSSFNDTTEMCNLYGQALALPDSSFKSLASYFHASQNKTLTQAITEKWGCTWWGDDNKDKMIARLQQLSIARLMPDVLYVYQ